MNLMRFPSIDKPWLKYYSEEMINAKLPESTLFEYMYQNNKDYPDDIAIVYFSTKITYGKLFRQIDACEKALLSLGVKCGDIVTIALPSVPEALYAVYALNKIGAVANLIHPLAGTDELIGYLNEVDSKVAILFDATYKIVKEKIAKTKVNTCVIVSPTDSLKSIIKVVHNFQQKKNRLKLEKNAVLWSDFIANSRNVQVEYGQKKSDELALILHTGGTTGEPVGVMLSDNAINACIWQIGCNIEHTRQECYMSVLPPYISYSLVNSMLEPLSFGFKVVLIPKYEAEKFDEYVKKYRPNYISSIPNYWEACLSNEKLRKMDLSCLKGVYYGGDALNKKNEEAINKLLLAGGAKETLKKGYGATELVSAATISFADCNDIGSVGIPLVKINCKVVDSDTYEELGYNEEGEICFSGPNTMLGYYKKEDATNAMIRVHADGKRWLHMGDLGHIDMNGNIYITGRIKRIMKTVDSEGNPTKMLPDRLEKVILQHSAVYLCCVVGVRDLKKYTVPKAAIVLKDGVEATQTIKEEILELCKDNLPDYMIPEFVVFMDSLPRTARGKVDYRALEEEKI